MCRDAVEAEPFEAHAQHEAGGLPPVALALEIGMQDEAELALLMLSARAPDAEVTDEPVRAPEQRGESKCLAPGSERGHRLDAIEPLPDGLA